MQETHAHPLPGNQARRGESSCADDEPTEVCTFGSALSIGQDAAITKELRQGSWPCAFGDAKQLLAAVERDLTITSRRWRGNHRTGGDYVPGDVLAIRARSALWLASLAYGGEWRDQKGQPIAALPPSARRDETLAGLLYAAVPNFLPASAALGVLASHPPEGSLLGELRLPFPAVAVFFGSDFDVPDELVGGEDLLARRDFPPFTVDDVLAGQTPLPDHAPNCVRFATLAAYRRQPLAIAGVVLTADGDGRLGDLVAFIVSKPMLERHLQRHRRPTVPQPSSPPRREPGRRRGVGRLAGSGAHLRAC